MRTTIATLLLTLLAVTLPAYGQITIPNATNATLVGSFSASTTVEVGYSADKKKKEYVVEWNIDVWATGGSQPVFTVAPGSLSFTDEDGVIDDVTAVDVFDAIGVVTVRKGVALGYLSCTSNCQSPYSTLFYTSSCVERSGSGSSTEFAHYSGASVRGYSYCCDGGPTTVTLTGANGTTSCSGQNIESTWDGAGQGSQIN